MEPVLERRAGHAARRQAKRGGGPVWAMDLAAAGIVLGAMWLAGRLPPRFGACLPGGRPAVPHKVPARY